MDATQSSLHRVLVSQDPFIKIKIGMLLLPSASQILPSTCELRHTSQKKTMFRACTTVFTAIRGFHTFHAFRHRMDPPSAGLIYSSSVSRPGITPACF